MREVNATADELEAERIKVDGNAMMIAGLFGFYEERISSANSTTHKQNESENESEEETPQPQRNTDPMLPKVNLPVFFGTNNE